VHDGQSLLVDRVYVGTVFLQEEGEGGVASEDDIVEAGEALVVLAVEPLPFAFLSVLLRLLDGHLVVLLEEVGEQFVVIVVGGDVQEGAVVAVDQAVAAVHEGLEQLLALLLVETLNCLEQLRFAHLYNYL
jgi:hypothetical protein